MPVITLLRSVGSASTAKISSERVTFDRSVTPREVCEQAKHPSTKTALLALLDGVPFDFHRPIERDAELRILTRDDDEILPHLRHSCAHILAEAVQTLFPGTQVGFGPPTEYGFFYDFLRSEPFVPDDWPAIEAQMRVIVDRDSRFVREEWSRDQAEAHFRAKGETLKAEHVRAIPSQEALTIYRQGDWLDLCRGPHLPSTGKVGKAFEIVGVAGAYWRGDSKGPQLQRISVTAWRSAEELAAHKTYLEQVQRRDHRVIGKKMSLFHLQEEATGSVFWHPKGWSVYRGIEDYIRACQRQCGYVEVRTPQLLSRRLWEASGHWDKFRDAMFVVREHDDLVHGSHRQHVGAKSNASNASNANDANDANDAKPESSREASSVVQSRSASSAQGGHQEHPAVGTHDSSVYAIKPMNCPGHIEIFRRMSLSYRQLPLRLAEFGSCHRNEPSGSLHGIMRVRAFTQDDAHIFCTPEQISSETAAFCRMLSAVYRNFGFESFSVRFSDRPAVRAGDDRLWDQAEESLRRATQEAGLAFELNKGEGAFYGPKLEFVLRDAIGRSWQCGTLQVDYILPERLDAHYVGSDGERYRPVLLHRAILGSLERFIGILLEHYEGNLPLWLAPVQVVVATVTDSARPWALDVLHAAQNRGLRVLADLRNEKIGYKVRQHTLEKSAMIWVVGERDARSGSVAVRRLGEEAVQTISLEEALVMVTKEALPPAVVTSPVGSHTEGRDVIGGASSFA